MTRRLGPALTFLIVLLGLGPDLLAGAAEAAVPADDLPTTAQVADVYPIFRGGSRDTYANREIAVRDRNCRYYRTAATARSGRWASYYDRNGEMPYFNGYQDPGVFVYEFGTQAQAHDALAVMRRYANRCAGWYGWADGTRLRVTKVAPGPLGQERVAYREYERSPNSVTTWTYRRSLDILVRRGRFLVEVMVQAESSAPHQDQAVLLTRVALRAQAS